MNDMGHGEQEQDSDLGQLRGRLADLERRVEALAELAAQLPSRLAGDVPCPCLCPLYYDAESAGDALV